MSTESAEKPADTTRQPRPAALIDHDALYVHLTRLLRATTTILADVDKNSAELHKHIEYLRAAVAEAEDLLYPPPPPERPADAEVLYAHAVRPGDNLFVRGEWVAVRAVEPAQDRGRDQVVFHFPASTLMPRHAFELMDPLPVRRKKPPEVDSE